MKYTFAIIAAFLTLNTGYFAQTTITTTHTNNNGNGSVIFNVQNTNAFDIIVTDVQCHLGTIATNNVQLLYRTTPFVDLAAPWDFGTVGAGQNGWISAGTGVVSNSNTANGIVPATLNVISHVEIDRGAFYPEGGMHSITKALVQLAKDIGIEFRFSNQVNQIIVEQKTAKGIVTANGKEMFDCVKLLVLHFSKI